MKKLFILFIILLLGLPAFTRQIRHKEMTRDKDFEFPKMEMDNPPLIFNGYAGDPVINPPHKFFGVEDRDRFSTDLWLVQFNGPVGPEAVDSLEDTGIKVHAYLPMFAFLVEFSSTTREDPVQKVRANIPDVRWMQEYYPQYRRPRGMVSGSDQAAIERAPYSVLATASLAGTYEEIYSVPLNDTLYTAKYNLYPHQIKEITEHPSVLYVHPSVVTRSFNYPGRSILGAENYWGIFSHVEEEDNIFMEGSQIVFSATDTGLDAGDPEDIIEDFLDYAIDREEDPEFPFLEEVGSRVRNIFDLAGDDNPADLDGHGTHVAGSIIGNGFHSGLWGDIDANRLEWGNYAGAAPRGLLYFLAATDTTIEDAPANLAGIDNNPYQINLDHPDYVADIYNHSWGQLDPLMGYGAYPMVSMVFDQVLWNDTTGRDDVPRKLAFISAGNSGIDRTMDGVINWDSLAAPATAKNVVAVGASENQRPGYMEYRDMDRESFPSQPIYGDDIADSPGGLAAFSSRGPTQDHRIKPDIVSPGTNVVSVLSTEADEDGLSPFEGEENYAMASGTSMASPLAAGASGVLKEYLAERLDMGFTAIPSYALKALLLTATDELYPGQYDEGEYPDVEDEREYGPGEPVPLDPDYPELRRKEIPFIAPNPDEGWGRLNVSNFLRTSPAVVDLLYTTEEDGIQWQETLKYTFNVDEVYDREQNRFFPIKALLTWHDYPGMVGTGGLVNDLDMVMEAPDGTIFYPNQYLDDTSYLDILSEDRVSFSNNDGSWEELLDESEIQGYAFKLRFENYPVSLTDIYFGLKSKIPVFEEESLPAKITIYEGTDVHLPGEELYESEYQFPNAEQPGMFRYSLADDLVIRDDVFVSIKVDPNHFDGLKDTDTVGPTTYKIIRDDYIPLEEGNFMADSVGTTNIHKISNHTDDHDRIENRDYINGYYARLEVPDYPAFIDGVSLGLKTAFPSDHRDKIRLRLYENTDSPDELGRRVTSYTYEIPAQEEAGMVYFNFPRRARINSDSLLEVKFIDEHTQGLVDTDVPPEEYSTWNMLTTGEHERIYDGNFMVDFYASYYVPRRQDVETWWELEGPIVQHEMGENHGFITYHEPDFEGYVPDSFILESISFPLTFNPEYLDGLQPDADVEIKVFENFEIENDELVSHGDLLHTYDVDIPYGTSNYEFEFPDEIEIETGRVLYQVVFKDEWDHSLPDGGDSLVHIYRDENEVPVCWMGTDVDEDGNLTDLEMKGVVDFSMNFTFELPRLPWGEFNADKFNNVQGIHLPRPPMTGEYTLYVYGYNIPRPRGNGQPFALSVSYNAGDVPDHDDPDVEPPVGDDPGDDDDDDETFIDDWMFFD